VTVDGHNLCQTPTTYRLLRLEYLLGLLVAAGFFLAHLAEVRWWVAVVLFVYVDVIGCRARSPTTAAPTSRSPASTTCSTTPCTA
jgi:hypothetical protein